jgi:3'(2'), 5'-bisphosphate nucleotidase
LNLDKLIFCMEEILYEVGFSLISLREKLLNHGSWEGTQFKSQSDKIAEDIILNKLRGVPLNLPVVSEEDVKSHLIDSNLRYWLVDPIDGTASFCGGYSGFVTQIALMEGNKPLLGAVFAPAYNLMYLANRGEGATLNGRPLKIDWPNNEITLIDNYPKPTGIANLIFERLNCSQYIESGSIGLKICRVAEGKASLFVKDIKVRDWDLAPGHLILNEAGGFLVDLRGFEIQYGNNLRFTNGLIATNSKILVDKTIQLTLS